MPSHGFSHSRRFAGTPKTCKTLPPPPPIPPPPPDCNCAIELDYHPAIYAIVALCTACNPARPPGETIMGNYLILPPASPGMQLLPVNCTGNGHAEWWGIQAGKTYTVQAFLTWSNGDHCRPSATITT